MRWLRWGSRCLKLMEAFTGIDFLDTQVTWNLLWQRILLLLSLSYWETLSYCKMSEASQEHKIQKQRSHSKEVHWCCVFLYLILTSSSCLGSSGLNTSPPPPGPQSLSLSYSQSQSEQSQSQSGLPVSIALLHLSKEAAVIPPPSCKPVIKLWRGPYVRYG